MYIEVKTDGDKKTTKKIAFLEGLSFAEVESVSKIFRETVTVLDGVAYGFEYEQLEVTKKGLTFVIFVAELRNDDKESQTIHNWSKEGG